MSTATAPKVRTHTPRAKSAAQRAKAAENVRLAEERLKMLQEKQRLANEARKEGFFGTDDQVIEKRAIAQKEFEAAQQVQSILSACGVYRRRVEGFLAARITREPTFVLEKLNDFFSRERNADVKMHVDKVLEHRANPAPETVGLFAAARS